MLAVSGLALLFTKFSFVLALPFAFTGRLNIWLLLPDPNVFSALNHINKPKKPNNNNKKNHVQCMCENI